jgi:ADP-dependent NAD(P)H-hydrate dehydratase / NAD(P)H-hydrate epimerase
MIPILTVSQIRALDAKAIAGDVAVGYSYMRRAGEGLFEAVRKMVPERRMGDITVICGKGNNGGDGFVVSRLLLEAEYSVMCFGLCSPDELRGEAKMAYDDYVARGGNFLLLDDLGDLCDLSRCSLVIDALLGSGLRGSPHGLTAEIIETINRSGAPVLAVDTPSGLDNDCAVPGKPCISARTTVAMGFPKMGAFFYPGKSCVGQLIIKDLKYPRQLVEEARPSVFLPTMERLKSLLPPRKPSGSKFDHGCVALICGSSGMTGSAVLASTAALRTGCGMAHLFSPKSAIAPLSARLIEVVLHGIDETPEGRPAYSAAASIKQDAHACQAMCLGPGISHDGETVRLVKALVAEIALPKVLDADGINAYKGCASALKNHAGELIITPHRGEWERLFPPLPEHPVEKIKTLCETAAAYAMTILYKGNPTIVADSGGRAVIMPYGNSGMATAGCGDVLTGCIASLAAQGCSLADAAVLGAYLHGRAGEIASERLGEYSMMAGDLLTDLPAAILTLIGK